MLIKQYSPLNFTLIINVMHLVNFNFGPMMQSFNEKMDQRITWTSYAYLII